MNDVKRLEFGRICTPEGCRVPTIEIIDPTKTDENGVIGYMTPFRCYSFQISGTVTGKWDLASTRVIGLGHLVNIQHQDGLAFRSNMSMDGISKELILGMIALCLNNFIHGT